MDSSLITAAAFVTEYCSIMLCSVLIYSALAHVPLSKKHYAAAAVYIPLAAISAYAVRCVIQPMNILFILGAVTVFIYISSGKTQDPKDHTIKLAICAAIVSFSLSFLLFVAALFLSSPLLYLVYKSISDTETRNLCAYVIIAVVHVLLTNGASRLKRVRTNASLSEIFTDRIAVIAGSVIVFIITVTYAMTSEQSPKSLYILTIVITLSCIELIYVLKNISMHTYVRKANENNAKRLEDELREKEGSISRLTDENMRLSKIIHRDNKMIPAMELAVEEILSCASPEEQRERSEQLLVRLRALSEERDGIVREIAQNSRDLPKTGLSATDGSLELLAAKADECGVTFDVSVLADKSSFTHNGLTELDLNTLLLDLGENAIHSASEAGGGHVLVLFGMEDGGFALNVYDSGAPFDKRVTEKLGRERVTTRGELGGSGIGLMTASQLADKYGASFIIDEHIDSDIFTKRVCVSFC